MSDKYILEGKTPKAVDLMEWAKWFETVDRVVEKTSIGDVDVSTVFLGLDHSFGSGPPLLFESMIFGGDLDQETDRYETYEQAEAGHSAMVARVND